MDGSGKIRYTEFLASTIEAQGAIDERRLAEAFDRLDSDDSGYITVQNLREMLGDDFPEAEIDEIIKESDITKDGKISYVEFLAQWQDHKEAQRQDMVLDISSMQMRESLHGDTGSTADSSEDGHDFSGEDAFAKVNFMQAKQHSERKSTGQSPTAAIPEGKTIETADI